jgi:hypothetical protein
MQRSQAVEPPDPMLEMDNQIAGFDVFVSRDTRAGRLWRDVLWPHACKEKMSDSERQR